MVIDKETFLEQVTRRIMVTKKVPRVTQSEVEEVVGAIYDDLEYFNTMPLYTMSVGGRPLDQVLVAEEWADFVQPESVRFDPTDFKTHNLLADKDVEACDTSAFDAHRYQSFIENQTRIRNMFKAELKDKVTNLAKLRCNKSLFDAVPVMAVQFEGEDYWRVRSVDQPFVPIKLCKELNVLFRSDYYNTDLDTIITDYFTQKNFI